MSLRHPVQEMIQEEEEQEEEEKKKEVAEEEEMEEERKMNYVTEIGNKSSRRAHHISYILCDSCVCVWMHVKDCLCVCQGFRY